MFDTQLFEKELSTSWLGRELFFYESLESTNKTAKNLERESTKHGSLVLADTQTAGKGQYDRFWDSKSGQNLTFTLLFEPTSGDRLSILTLANALAIADTIEEQTKSTSKIKWPNDVLIGGKKIAGLLTETQFSGNDFDRAIVGIGINVNQEEFNAKIRESAISFKNITNQDISRERLLARILSRIEYYYRLWDTQNIELIKSINKRLIGYGKWTRLTVNGEDLDGEYKFLGINEAGHMVVLNKELEVNTFSYEQIRVQLSSEPSK